VSRRRVYSARQKHRGKLGERVTRDELRALLEQARALQPTNRAPRDTSRNWCRISNKGDEADVYIYDEIGFWGTPRSRPV
jgi:hypothetical protein